MAVVPSYKIVFFAAERLGGWGRERRRVVGGGGRVVRTY